MQHDLIVIGAGQAGVPLATRFAAAGRQVLLVERSRVGGTCVNYGCTPTKTMVASARAAHVARTGARLGVRVLEVSVDFEAVVSRKDAVVSQWRASLDRRLAEPGDRLRLARGHARFTGEREIEVGGERHRAKVVVVNVGVRPAPPPVPGLIASAWLDNHRLLGLRELPRHLVVLGGGYIGCEFAQMFRRFGSAVSVVQRASHLLDREDEDVSEALEEVFRREGVALHLDARVAGAFQRGPSEVGLTLEDGREIAGSHLLGAVGRRPNTDDLACEQAGVRLDTRGYIPVNDAFETSAAGVYAVGDVTGGAQFTHTSWDDHRILFDILEGRRKGGRSGRVIPYTVFTDPQVAGVGLSEREARRRGLAFEVARMPFGQIARAIEIDEPAGLLKVLVDPATERILGASLVGAEAGELVHILAALMQAGASARAVVDVEMAHPTFAEGLQSAVMQLKRFALR